MPKKIQDTSRCPSKHQFRYCFKQLTLSIFALSSLLCCDLEADKENSELFTSHTIEASSLNDFAVISCDSGEMLLTIASLEAALIQTNLDNNRTKILHFETKAGQPPSNPFSISAQQTKNPLAVISLYGQHRIALIDPCQMQLLDLPKMVDQKQKSLKISLQNPIILRHPYDLNQDGILEGTAEHPISTLELRHPQALQIDGHDVYALFTNLLEVADEEQPQILAAGVLLHLTIANNKLTYVQHHKLHYKNPQGLYLQDNKLYILSSGTLGPARNNYAAVSDSGVEIFELPLSIELQRLESQTINLKDFSPIAMAQHGSERLFTSLNKAQVQLLDPNAEDSSQNLQVLTLGAQQNEGHSLDSIFSILKVTKEKYLLPQFSTDRLHLLSFAQNSKTSMLLNQAEKFKGGLLLKQQQQQLLKGSSHIKYGPNKEKIYILQQLSSQILEFETKELLKLID